MAPVIRAEPVGEACRLIAPVRSRLLYDLLFSSLLDLRRSPITTPLQTFAPTVSQAIETIDQLRHHLKNAGYSQFLTCDEADRVAVYDLRLEKSGRDWRVFETERGQEIATYAKTSDEGEASRAFLQIVSTRTYPLKTCNDTEIIAKFEAILEAAGIPFQRNDVPYEGKLRVFVTGSNLLKAQQVAALSSA